jgi:quercetin dioxygenase-like cupin family protein
MTSEQQEPAVEYPPFHRPSNTDVVYWGPRDSITFLATGKDTNGAYTQFEVAVLPGGGPPPHIHHREDETFYVVEGNLEIRLGEVNLLAQPGDYLRVPRDTVHAFRNVGEHLARMLLTMVPAGFEGYFMEVYQPVADLTAPPPEPPADLLDRMIQAAPPYGLEFVPPPESGASTETGLQH